MFLWLTVNLPNLCIYVYIRTATPGMAPARPPWLALMPACVPVCWRIMCASYASDAHMLCLSCNCVPRYARQSTVMVSVAIQHSVIAVMLCRNVYRLQWRSIYPSPTVVISPMLDLMPSLVRVSRTNFGSFSYLQSRVKRQGQRMAHEASTQNLNYLLTVLRYIAP